MAPKNGSEEAKMDKKGECGAFSHVREDRAWTSTETRGMAEKLCLEIVCYHKSACNNELELRDKGREDIKNEQRCV